RRAAERRSGRHSRGRLGAGTNQFSGRLPHRRARSRAAIPCHSHPRIGHAAACRRPAGAGARLPQRVGHRPGFGAANGRRNPEQNLVRHSLHGGFQHPHRAAGAG
nr:hypothetical protein [Tanacetum cinerariifolium]